MLRCSSQYGYGVCQIVLTVAVLPLTVYVLSKNLLDLRKQERDVRSDGDEDEDDGFKIRTAERQLEEMKRAVEEKQIVIAKMKARSEEKADVRAMHDHTHGGEDQARQSRLESDSDRATRENPLQE